MGLLLFEDFVLLLVLTTSLCSVTAATCEETETGSVKLDLAKQSISRAKALYPKYKGNTGDSNCTREEKASAYLNAALDLITEAKLLCRMSTEPIVTVGSVVVVQVEGKPMDCVDVLSSVSNKSGVYQVWPRGNGIVPNASIDVYCDMETDGGGWTVLQRRGDFSKRIDFYRDWEAYKKGFGNLKEEFWLGNDKIFNLTNQSTYSVRFDLVDVQLEYRYAAYSSFSIGDEKTGYVLHIDNHTGNASNDMRYSDRMRFSTKDRTNDGRDGNNACADSYMAAFWHPPGCSYVNLNGLYKPGVNERTTVWWYDWKVYECLYSVEMKIRRNTV